MNRRSRETGGMSEPNFQTIATSGDDADAIVEAIKARTPDMRAWYALAMIVAADLAANLELSIEAHEGNATGSYRAVLADANG